MNTTSTRERILDVAADLFVASGPDGATMDQVRLAAEVSNGSLYHHFPSKADLEAALYQRALLGFHAALLEPIDGGASTRQAVIGMVLAALDWAERWPTQARLLHTLRPSLQAAGRDAWSADNERSFGRLAQWVATRTAAGRMRPLPWPAWSALVFAPVAAVTRQAAASGTLQFPAELRTALAEGAWRAVAPEPSKP